ncbi:hypothetical protein DPMN_179770 [Dreissena polymorpha]|uniref:Uncharacterized protein n=1 Tax=Dreissena polymorpha TaxID=45954 RepID=A0A9D4EF31_DREPO|nr:hypothetical protein DPMN_179770 [Dreissena polymorpha]
MDMTVPDRPGSPRINIWVDAWNTVSTPTIPYQHGQSRLQHGNKTAPTRTFPDQHAPIRIAPDSHGPYRTFMTTTRLNTAAIRSKRVIPGRQ